MPYVSPKSTKVSQSKERSKILKRTIEINSVEVDDKGRDYFDIFGAAHKWSDGAIDGANIMTDGVIDGGLAMAGGALDGVNTMANGAIGGLYCLFHRCLRGEQRGGGGQRRQQRGQDRCCHKLFELFNYSNSKLRIVLFGILIQSFFNN